MSSAAAGVGAATRTPWVILTGADSGIGRETRRRLLSSRANVAAVDLRDTVDDAAVTFVGDATDPELAPAVVAAIEERGGRIQGLVNAAGIALLDRDGPLHEIAPADWQRTIDVNLNGAANFSRAVVPAMLRGGGGAMVHVASIAGLRGMDTPADAYQVSKAALVSLSRALAMAHAGAGIRSNTVCPGAILTPMISSIYEEDPTRRADMEARTPLGRLGRPEDVAAAILFLLSAEADFITGIDLVVDGGLMAKLV